MGRHGIGLGFWAALVVASSAAGQDSRPTGTASAKLFTTDATEGLLIDRDGDGRPDGVRPLRFDVGAGPEAAAAAAEIAARVGLEVCALDGPPEVVEAAAAAGTVVRFGRAASGDAGVALDGAVSARRFAATWPESWDEAAAATRPAAPRKGKERRLALDKLFDAGQLLTDDDGDLVPDGSDATLVPSGEPGSASAAVHVAMRIGLEAAGLRFPLAQTPAELPADKVAGPLVLVGAAQPLVEDLKRRGLLGAEPADGEGEVVVVNLAFGKQAAVVVRGGGVEGLKAAGRLFFERIPHLDRRRVGTPGLAELATEARRLVAGVSVEGQRARVGRELGIFAQEAAGQGPFDGFRVRCDALPGGRARERVERRWALTDGGVKLRGDRETFEVQSYEAGPLTPGQMEPFEFLPPWEVERAFDRVKESLQGVRDGAAVEVEVRVSESAAQRETLALRLRDLVPPASRDAAKIVVRSAWKPAYFHLVEELLPKWKERGVVRATLAARTHVVDGVGGTPSTLEPPTRLLQELYPADDVVARTLDLRVGEDVRLELLPVAAPADYVFTTVDRAGNKVEDLFDVAFHERPFNAVLPEADRVVVWSGLVRVAVDGKTVVRDRQTTDLEEVWDAYQSQVLPRLRDLALQGTNGRPEPRHAPWFHSLRAYATLSEPDETLPFGLGRSSALDMLHEELYFHTLGFVQSLGGVYGDKPFEFPGRVVPRVSETPGAPPRLAIDLSPRASHAPKIEALRRLSADEFEVVATREIRPIDVKDPRVTSLRVAADGTLAAGVTFRCDVDADDRAAALARHRPEDADTKVFSAEQGVRTVEETVALRALGARRSEWFAYPDVTRIDFRFEAEGKARTASLVVDRPDLRAPEANPADAPLTLIPDERPLRPHEAAGALATLVEKHADLGLRVRHVGRSTLGRDLWTLESGPFPASPDEPEPHFARRKLAAWKPVYAVSAREHANEVSSTTHVLQWFRELLATKPEALKDIRVALNPVWNADGADLAMDCAADRPDDLLHAGYLGPYGENLSVGQDERDPLHAEAKLRLDLFATHLPDVFFNPHGYPMHEWVQPFSGYAAWVKKRDPKTRDWWIPRGAFVQTFQHVDDEDEPAYARIAADLRARLGRAIAADPAVRALNDDQYARYARWSAFLPADLRLPLVEGTAVYGPLRGVDAKKDAVQFVQRAPKTCVANVILEVPDETASGEHLKTVCAAGRAVSWALTDFLRERAAHPDVKVTPHRDGATRVRARARLK